MKDLGRFFTEIRKTYWGDLFYRGLRYSPVAYYGFLFLYCIISLILGRETISPIAALPYVYSFLAPAILLLVVYGVRFVASILYRDQRFRSGGCASIILIVIAIFMATLPFSSGLLDLDLKEFPFQWVDFLLITLSLWDIVVRIFFSIPKHKQEEDLIYAWLDKLNDVAMISIIVQFWVIGLIGLPLGVYMKAAKILDRQDTWVALSVLAVGYLSIAVIRWFMVGLQLGRIPFLDRIWRKEAEAIIHRNLKEHNRIYKSESTEDHK